MRRNLLFVCLLLASCKVGPDYHRPPAVVPVTYKEVPKGWVPAQPFDGLDRGAWWQIFNDPILNGLEAEIDISNQTLKQYAAALRAARAVVQETRAQLFPVLAANVGVQRESSGTGSSRSGGFTTTASGVGVGSTGSGSGSITRTTYTVEGTASWDLDLWGRIRRQVESNVAAAQATAAQLASARLSAQGELATDYFQLRYEDSLGKLLNDTVAAYQRSLQITQNQYDAGVAARSDVITAQTQLLGAQSQLVNVGVQRAQLEHAIAILTGHPPVDLTIAPGSLSGPLPTVPVAIPSTLLQRRPDIAQAERAMQEQDALIGVAVAAFYPDVTLSALFGYVGDPIGSLISSSNRVWSLAASASETLFEGGERSAAVAAARATYDEAVASYRETVLTAFQGVEDQLSSLRILAQQNDVEQAAVRAATQATGIAVNEYRAGTQAFTTVVTAQATQLADQEAALAIQESRFTATVALVQALGGGWTAADLPTKHDF